jgi:CheY-like chemotaxis protein
MMPDLDGYEVCRRIKKDKATKDIPVVVVSASGGKEITRKIKKAGADDHLVKPFDHDEILNVISDYLKAGKKGSQKPAASPKSKEGEHRDTAD